ncbi:MAG: hypothetical protein JW934_14555 [Anaerolineae bacterium]|nr:hypothetical protein [Anaerolineae bacterium]
MAIHLSAPSIDVLQRETGVAIPVYLSPKIDQDLALALLRDNVAAYVAQTRFSEHICLSVDGLSFGARQAVEIAAEFGVSLAVAEVNRGKLWGAIHGVRKLLENSRLKYIALVDQDGDHFASELLNLVRAAEHIVAREGHQRVLVLGQRTSRHRPMGFLRGELEELGDRVLLDALHYRAATTGKPLPLSYVTPFGEFPDFHSGYKLFSRETAQAVFGNAPNLAGCSDDCYYRHAVEAVMVVEALEAGAVLGVVNRSTFNEQPFTTFGQFDAAQLMADTVIWPCKRLGVPLAFVRQWLDNHIPRLLLSTIAPEGKTQLARVRQLVLESYGVEIGETWFQQPLFV